MKIFKKEETKKLANILKKDGIISVPTDTVYGLCARINSKNALEKLLKIKNRPKEKNFAIMCKNKEQIEEIAKVNSKIEKIIKKLMPGPITLILEKQENLLEHINSKIKTIAVRMATSKKIFEIIDELGEPVFMTSANKSGEQVANSIEEISRIFPDLDGILEGNVFFGKSSTILDCTNDELKIIREGPISLEEIKKIIKWASI